MTVEKRLHLNKLTNSEFISIYKVSPKLVNQFKTIIAEAQKLGLEDATADVWLNPSDAVIRFPNEHSPRNKLYSVIQVTENKTTYVTEEVDTHMRPLKIVKTFPCFAALCNTVKTNNEFIENNKP